MHVWADRSESFRESFELVPAGDQGNDCRNPDRPENTSDILLLH